MCAQESDEQHDPVTHRVSMRMQFVEHRQLNGFVLSDGGTYKEHEYCDDRGKQGKRQQSREDDKDSYFAGFHVLIRYNEYAKMQIKDRSKTIFIFSDGTSIHSRPFEGNDNARTT